jgi:hypothetical protein
VVLVITVYAASAFLILELGETEKALEILDCFLEQAFNDREGWLVLLKVEPLFDNLRTDPRFQRIQDQMNFPDQGIWRS